MKFIFKISRVVWHLLFQLPKLIIILKFHKNFAQKKATIIFPIGSLL